VPDRPTARLVLEDGSVFPGRAFGALGDARGEVVFCTAMTGYQEAITDPSYAGQILTLTAPLIGNYGIAAEDMESTRPQIAGLVIRELARRHSNQRAVRSLSDWLAGSGVPGIEGVDTRAIVRLVRIKGALRGVLVGETGPSDAELVEQARALPPMAGQNLACSVSPTSAGSWTEDLGAWKPAGAAAAAPRSLRVLALDCGAKRNIYRHLVARGCDVQVAPHDCSAEQIRASAPDGLFVSNGPGDPAAVKRTVAVLREVAGSVPTFGICLGHQLLALALGATTYKLKFGHRGANQPVRSLLTGRVEITSQNHGFCVDADSLAAAGCEITHVNLNDGTVAGFRHRSRPIFAVQYHPEASPGPHDSGYLFDCFVKMMLSGAPVDAEQVGDCQRRAAALAAADAGA
jgi:carbamoyl-phosphate synthase small subunit